LLERQHTTHVLTPCGHCSQSGFGGASRPFNVPSVKRSRQEKIQETSSTCRTLAACIHCAGIGLLAGKITMSPASSRSAGKPTLVLLSMPLEAGPTFMLACPSRDPSTGDSCPDLPAPDLWGLAGDVALFFPCPGRGGGTTNTEDTPAAFKAMWSCASACCRSRCALPPLVAAAVDCITYTCTIPYRASWILFCACSCLQHRPCTQHVHEHEHENSSSPGTSTYE